MGRLTGNQQAGEIQKRIEDWLVDEGVEPGSSFEPPRRRFRTAALAIVAMTVIVFLLAGLGIDALRGLVSAP